MRTAFYLSVLSLITLLFSCNPSNGVDPVDPPNPNPNPTDNSATNTWQCTIDGHPYSGPIDTSFLQIFFGGNGPDSVIASTGTSSDRKAHIHFKFSMNRTLFPASGVNNNAANYFVFDTAANNLFTANIFLQNAFNYKVDTATPTHLVVSYSGTLTDQRSQNHTIAGKFSCKPFQGSGEPNKFFSKLAGQKHHGYFNGAAFNANTLVLEGIDYVDYPFYRYRLIVRTGGTIKPGTYKAENGDVGFFAVSTAPSGNSFFADDSLGALTVTINSVNGNIVDGIFSGTNEQGQPIDSGYFRCRVSNYTPQTDAVNRWGFGAWIGTPFGFYNTYAGNITGATRSTNGGRNYLTIRGESDNGASSFRIVVSSSSPITPGPYILNGFPDNVLDSVYFKSGKPSWDGQFHHLYAGHETASLGGQTTVWITSITATRVTGRFEGIIHNNIVNELSPDAGERQIRKGVFTADF